MHDKEKTLLLGAANSLDELADELFESNKGIDGKFAGCVQDWNDYRKWRRQAKQLRLLAK